MTIKKNVEPNWTEVKITELLYLISELNMFCTNSSRTELKENKSNKIMLKTS